MSWNESKLHYDIKELLISRGHSILARDNPKSSATVPKSKIRINDSLYYVDIISEKDNSLYLTEIKYDPTESDIQSDIDKLDFILQHPDAITDLVDQINIETKQPLSTYSFCPVIGVNQYSPTLSEENYIICNDTVKDCRFDV